MGEVCTSWSCLFVLEVTTCGYLTGRYIPVDDEGTMHSFRKHTTRRYFETARILNRNNPLRLLQRGKDKEAPRIWILGSERHVQFIMEQNI